MGYFMPRLVEFALNIEQISKNEQEPYLWGFILQIMPDSGWNRFLLFEKKHKKFICKILNAINREYMEFIRNDCFKEEFMQTLEAWCRESSA